jgi:methylphosphotriester-DNA--protein-cysteine methyltransferase
MSAYPTDPRIEQYVSALPKWQQQLCRKMRDLVHALEQGMPIRDTVFEAGYFDQPHLTRALKHFIGQTPAQIAE